MNEKIQLFEHRPTKKLKSWQISGVRYTGRNHKRPHRSDIQIMISNDFPTEIRKMTSSYMT